MVLEEFNSFELLGNFVEILEDFPISSMIFFLRYLRQLVTDSVINEEKITKIIIGEKNEEIE